MSVNTDNLFEVTVVRVSDADRHLQRTELRTEMLYHRINKVMLNDSLVKSKSPIVTYRALHTGENQSSQLQLDKRI